MHDVRSEGFDDDMEKEGVEAVALVRRSQVPIKAQAQARICIS